MGNASVMTFSCHHVTTFFSFLLPFTPCSSPQPSTRNKNILAMAPTATVTRHQEVTLKVEAPQLDDKATSTTKTAALEGNSFWTVTLTRNQASLQVSAVWYRQQHMDITNYIVMHIIPHSSKSSILEKANSGSSLMQGGAAQCK